MYLSFFFFFKYKQLAIYFGPGMAHSIITTWFWVNTEKCVILKDQRCLQHIVS